MLKCPALLLQSVLKLDETDNQLGTARFGAILAAGGAGTRFSSTGRAKQFLELSGRPMYLWPLEKLVRHSSIDLVVVVVPEASIDSVHEHLRLFGLGSAEQNTSSHGAVFVIAGGATRQQSVFHGLQFLQALARPPEFVLIHDGARPFVTDELIGQVAKTVAIEGACTPGLPVTDTLKRVREQRIVETVDRHELFSVQTPQAGRLRDLCDAHTRAVTENWAVTDDASMLERQGLSVAIVPGYPYNLKVTQPLDLVLCEALAPRLLVRE